MPCHPELGGMRLGCKLGARRELRLDCSCRVRRLDLRFTGREAREGRECRLGCACDSRSGIGGGGGGWFWICEASSTPASLLKGCILYILRRLSPVVLAMGVES
jgi:hypothetical protein